MAIPVKVLADDPPETVSVESEKLLEKRLETVEPAGEVLSSSIAASVAEPLATGASLRGLMVWLSETEAEE